MLGRKDDGGKERPEMFVAPTVEGDDGRKWWRGIIVALVGFVVYGVFYAGQMTQTVRSTEHHLSEVEASMQKGDAGLLEALKVFQGQLGTLQSIVQINSDHIARVAEWEEKRDAAGGLAEFERYKQRTVELQNRLDSLERQISDVRTFLMKLPSVPDYPAPKGGNGGR